MNGRKPPSMFYIIGGLLKGLTALVISGSFLCIISGRDFWPVFFATSTFALLSVATILLWLTRWAKRDDGQLHQFGIGTLLMFTSLAAVFLGFVRWLTADGQVLYDAGNVKNFVIVSIASVILMAFSLIPLLSMAESLVWLAARVLRWNMVRRSLFGETWPKDDHRDERD